MHEDADIARRIETLEENVRILAEENERLAGRAEDALLLSLIAEEINPAEHAEQVLRRGLERISILKDVPFAGCCVLVDRMPVLVTSYYQHGSDREPSLDFELPATLFSTESLESVCLVGDECRDVCIPVFNAGEVFSAESVLVIPVRVGGDADWVYVFADDRQDAHLGRLSIMLHRAVDMMSSRIELINLLDARQELNEQLQAANAALMKATQAKSDFLANMTHEIRTPMNAILGFAQLMRRDPGITAEQRERLDIINRSGEHLLALINDVLEMAKIEAGRVVINNTAFGLAMMVQDLHAVFADQARPKGVRVTAQVAEDMPAAIVTDAAKLRQVLVNLLANAVKFTEVGTVALRVGWERAEAGTIRLLFEVEDTGVGIRDDEADLLFTKFAQTSSGRHVGTGTGLGLAISREYVQLLGGDISVESRLGVGSTFRFEVSAGIAEEFDARDRHGGEIATALAPEQPRFRVLVADDYEEMRVLVAQMLEGLGFEVATVCDGREAVDRCLEWRPDVVLMDMRMPVMDGPEAMRRIREAEVGGDVRIVALTASAFAETRADMLSRGADAFVAKPFGQAELLDVLAGLLDAEYVYGELSGTSSPSVRSEARAALPPELAGRVVDAAMRADFDAVLELADEVGAEDAETAAALREMAQDYDVEAIIDAFGRTP